MYPVLSIQRCRIFAKYSFRIALFESNKLGRKVSYSIYLPSDYNTSKRNYPVLYLLHGYTDNETNWIQMGQMKTIADRAIANEEAVPMIIVMPDAWDTWYINQYDGKVPYEDMFLKNLSPIWKNIPDSQ